ncbi:MAG: HEAT repeat domain-containing protein [Hormoscilla sp. GUM202]|nr:HEAT repeat domain-containing protein [Hormoscilla sp. GUM202]
MKLLHSSENEAAIYQAANSLGKIAPIGNKKAIGALVKLLHSSDDEFTRRQAADSLIKIDGSNKKAFASETAAF